MFVNLRERKTKRDRERQRNIDTKRYIDWLPSICTPTGFQTHSLGMCPDWGLSLQLFGIQEDVPNNLATQPWLLIYIFLICVPSLSPDVIANYSLKGLKDKWCSSCCWAGGTEQYLTHLSTLHLHPSSHPRVLSVPCVLQLIASLWSSPPESCHLILSHIHS